MLKSLKFRFITLLIFMLAAILSLAIVQYSYSKKINHLYESKLALKELQLKHIQMELAETNFFLTHNIGLVNDVEVYANTMEVYFGIVDDYLQEFTYPQSLGENIDLYIDTFMQISKLPQKKSQKYNNMVKKLHTYADKIDTYIQNEQGKLTPIITHKIESITSIQNFIYIFMSLMTIFMIIIIFKPIINNILILKQFFADYKNSSDRLILDKLNFNELKDIAQFVNKMLDEQEKTQKELLASRDEALHLQKVKDEFLSNMSHELRTPLNAIGGFSRLLLKKLPQECEIIDPIVDSAAHLLQLVSDILDLSKIQSGKFQIVEDEFELYYEFESFSKCFTPLMKNKNITFNFNYDGSKNLHLIGDWFRISQILNNFMSNAIKFTPKDGEINLNIKYENETFYAGVQDSGIGIKKEALSNILKPFEQSDPSITKKFGGTGLGLSIAKTLTDMMNGTFNIESEIDEGSTFSISLPLKSIIKDVKEKKNNETTEEDISISAHVLIAEDNKTNQLLLTMLVDDLGITYDIANDGQEALDMFEEGKYDIILMDENMPNLSGTDSMLAIREKFSNVPPIIVVTANAMKGDKERLLKLGMDDFLSKPIDNDLLIKILIKNLHLSPSETKK